MPPPLQNSALTHPCCSSGEHHPCHHYAAHIYCTAYIIPSALIQAASCNTFLPVRFLPVRLVGSNFICRGWSCMLHDSRGCCSSSCIKLSGHRWLMGLFVFFFIHWSTLLCCCRRIEERYILIWGIGSEIFCDGAGGWKCFITEKESGPQQNVNWKQ